MRPYRISLFCILFALALFHCAPAPAAQQLSPALSGVAEQSKAEASGLFKAGEYDKACELYLRLLRELPDDPEVNMGLALSSARAGRHTVSVMAYERLIEMNPDIADFYVGLARAYTALGDEALGREYLERAQNLAPGLSDSDADRIMRAFKAETARHTFHGRLRSGFMYDSNANQGTSSNRMTLGAYDVLVPGAEGITSGAAYASANFDFGLRLAERGNLWLVADASGYLKGNFNPELLDRRVRNLTWGRGAAGLRYLSDKTLLEVKAKIEGMDYDSFQNVSAVGPETILAFSVLPRLQLVTRAGWEQRAYSRVPERDGSYFYAGEYLRLFFGSDNHEALLGARYIGGRPRHEAFRHDGWEALLRFSFNLPCSLELAPFISLTREFYHGPATVLERDKRDDTRWSAGATVTYRLTRNLSLEAGYRYAGNISNSDLHTYQQHVAHSGLAWSF